MNIGQTNTINELSAYDFDLPEELIASYPTAKRDQSRLLHYNLESKSLKHLNFTDITSILAPGDILVRNNSKVLPARFYVERARDQDLTTTENSNQRKDQNKIEILLLKARAGSWEAIAKPLKKIKNGEYLLSNGQSVQITRLDQPSSGEISAQILVDFGTDDDFTRAVNEAAEMPIPPYLGRQAEEIDRERYQTIYAQETDSGYSIAAPTAGLHFTDTVTEELRARGIKILDITLHVGLGTFLPVKSETITAHKMHSECYEIADNTWQQILSAPSEGKRSIAVGTTATRALESAARSGKLKAETDIFIYPHSEQSFKIIDGLITNFHLPRSTLLMLVSALAGREEILKIYKEAIAQRYRFFSYGDCMLLL